MFPIVFFFIFPPVRGSFFPPKMNVRPHFWPKKTHLTPGLRIADHYMAHGNVVLTFRFWCVTMYKDFFLSFYCHGYYVVKEVINRVHEVVIHKNLQWDPRKKETVIPRWWRGWIDSTTPSTIHRVNRMTADSYSAFQMSYIQTNFYYCLLIHLATGKVKIHQDFLLSSSCHGYRSMLSKRSSIEYMKLIFIKIYSETQERKSQSYIDDGGAK